MPLTTNSTCLATASPRAGPGFDVVLRPTKGVSILYGLGDPATGRAVLAAHHAGVAEAVAYLDTHIGTRRGHGGHEHVSGQGLLAVGFDHRTSREGDPLLHTHLVANRVQEPDGRWTALDGRDLYRHRLAADAIYRASYQRQLSRTLGVEWTAADAYGNRELEGLPEDLVRLDSKRTDRIDLEVERLEASGGSGPRGWSSGPSMPPASPKPTRPRTPCMDGGGRRRRAIKEIVVDHRAEKRWLGNARAGGSLLFVYAPTKERANRMVGLLAETWPSPAARPTSIIW